MAENYNFNSSFGLNVSTQGAKTQQIQKTTAEAVKNVANFLDSMTDYVSRYENVFDGSVQHEINKNSRQAMFVAMSLKAGDDKRQFDINI